MAIDIDDLLQPGERVHLRVHVNAVVGQLCLLFPTTLACVAFLSIMLHSFGAGNAEGPISLGFGHQTLDWIMVAVFVVWLALLVRRHQAEVAVTDRRLLYRPTNRQAGILELAGNDIRKVEWSSGDGPGAIEIVAEGGKSVTLARMRDPQAIADAIANLAGHSPPPSIGRMACVQNSQTSGAGTLMTATALIAFAYWLFRSLGIWTPDMSLSIQLIWVLVLLAVAIPVARTIGPPLAYLTAMLVLKPFVTADQMHAAVRLRDVHDGWRSRLYQRWARILFQHPAQAGQR